MFYVKLDFRPNVALKMLQKYLGKDTGFASFANLPKRPKNSPKLSKAVFAPAHRP